MNKDEENYGDGWPIGAPVKLSFIGQREFPKDVDARGVIVGYSRDKSLVRVQWSKYKTPSSYSPLFLENIT